MKNILKYVLLVVLIIGAYFLGKEIPALVAESAVDSESISRFLNSEYASIFFSLVIIYFVYDLFFEMIFSYRKLGDIFKVLVITAIFALGIYILMFNPDSQMKYEGVYDHGLPLVFILPLPFLLRDFGKHEISKTNIVMVFIISIILYAVYTLKVEGFDYKVLLIFLGIAFMSIVLFYIYFIGKTMILGKKLIRSSKNLKI